MTTESPCFCLRSLNFEPEIFTMTRNLKTFAFLGLALAAVASQAVTYNDAPNDEGLTGGSVGGHMDILSIDVTNTATDISFKFTVNGDLVATNWGKYCVVLNNLSNGTVDTSVHNNGWGRHFQLTGGSNAFIGSWVDQPTNNQLNYTYNGSWNQNSQVTNTITGTSMVTLTASLSDLGLSVGDTMIFDAVTTGGGDDTAIDSLTGATPANWGDEMPLQGVTYQVQGVPEPATMVMLGLGAAAMLRRKRKA